MFPEGRGSVEAKIEASQSLVSGLSPCSLRLGCGGLLGPVPAMK